MTERKYDDELGKTIWFQWSVDPITEVISFLVLLCSTMHLNELCEKWSLWKEPCGCQLLCFRPKGMPLKSKLQYPLWKILKKNLISVFEILKLYYTIYKEYSIVDKFLIKKNPKCFQNSIIIHKQTKIIAVLV